MREVHFEREYIKHPAGSCLSVFGDTKVICTATLEEERPPFLRHTQRGWLTAEYAMLPGSTGGGRKRRDGAKRDGRGTEIQRLIGRSLRAAVDLDVLGPISILIDCDVLQADGGTRTAAISGGWVALCDALRVWALRCEVEGPEVYLLGQVGAVSVGVVDGEVVCDLNYAQDSGAEVDMNVVKRDQELVEIQGTGEGNTFDRQCLAEMLDAADRGIEEIFEAQTKSLGGR